MISYLLFFSVYLILANYAVNMGYHRFLAHRSFKAKKWFENLIVVLGLPAGTPVQWAGNHRAHHRYEDTENDPHSPHFGGFWHAHNGWYIQTKTWWICLAYAFAGQIRTVFDGWHRPRTNQEYNHLAKDVSSDLFFKFLSRKDVYFLGCLIHAAVQIGVAYAFFGVPGILVAWFCSVVVYNLGDSVDSLGHLWGKTTFPEHSKATDNWLIAMLTFGDGWHATHHRFPSSACHGIHPGQFDWTFWQLKALKYVGIIEKLNEVSFSQVLAVHVNEKAQSIKISKAFPSASTQVVT